MASDPVVTDAPVLPDRVAFTTYVLPMAAVLAGLLPLAWSAATPSGPTPPLTAFLLTLPLTAIALVSASRVGTATGLTRRTQFGWRLLAAAGVVSVGRDVMLALGGPLSAAVPGSGWTLAASMFRDGTMLAGLLCLSRPFRSTRDAVKLGLDATMVVVGGAMAVWHFVVEPSLAVSGTAPLALLPAVFGPLGHLSLLLGATLLLLRCPLGPQRRPMLLLAGSVVALLIAELLESNRTISGMTRPGSAEQMFLAAYGVLLAASAALERARLPLDVTSGKDAAEKGFTLLPYAAGLGGYALLVGVAWDGSTPQTFHLLIGAFVLTLLGLSRQLVTVQETMRLTRERSKLASEARFRSLIQNASDIVTIFDPEWVVSFVSPSAAHTLGFDTEVLLRTTFIDFVHPEDQDRASSQIQQSLVAPGRPITARWRLKRSDGSWIQTENICTNLLHDENVRGLVLNSRDVSAQCALEAQLTYQAFHDPLTGLANRALFEDRVSHALFRREAGSVLGVLFVDLDHFKNVNDSLGHAAGDALLEAAAGRLASCLRPVDTVARLGGDEFAVLIEGSDGTDEVLAIAGRIAAAFLEPFSVEGHEVVASSSVGVAFASDGQSAEELLRNADLAMYLAKGRGRGRTATFEPEMHVAVLNRLELEGDLRHAVERLDFTLAFQPIHLLETRGLVGAEALARWTHPVRGSVPPSAFIPIAEETGLIVPLGLWVIDEACAEAVRWRETSPARTPLGVSVNLSGRQITEPTLVEDIQRILAARGLSPDLLTLELTESVLLQHTDQALSVMNRLRAIGVRLAIDDFGTGYSSLSYLQRLPIDVLKIDRAFVERLETDQSASAVARAIIGLSRSLSLNTVAEGIETPKQAEILRTLQCDRGQGYFFSTPLSAADFDAYTHRRRTASAA